MRTTLDIDPDVLQAIRRLAEQQGTTVGKVLSNLARQALEPTAAGSSRNGVPLVPRRPGAAPKPTLALVNQLRD